ncbi:hypothetical protein [Tropicibacter sp. Alg240-R139]|uniref:hypothetical protein n=1 Tax=Tropicibacter sp. Alg240-R139 TaxID=2305991 RepID=UPI0013DEC62C|nr:hypothetical protein [Tropicibacter sp. Alg240-R139]
MNESFEIRGDELNDFLAFLTDLEARPRPEIERVLALREKPSLRDYQDLEDWHKASEQFVLTHSGAAFRKLTEKYGDNFAKKFKNNLALNCEYVALAIEDQELYGTWPAPGFAKRIGIILRRAKMHDLSRQFELAHNDLVVEWRAEPTKGGMQ